jgi:hypothetical protein
VNPGVISLSERGRLSDAALAARPRTDAYVLGAAWLRPSLLAEQQRLKAGLLFDLEAMHRDALEHGRADLASLSATLGAWVRTLPVTGRQVALLDPRSVEASPADNRPVAQGDALYYPRRPMTIRLVGALTRPCELPFVALQDARQYLASCTRSRSADADWIFVIQPDVRVFKQGVGLWNRTPPLPLAPGGTIYVPLRAGSVRGIAPDLNSELAAFLGTQPIAEAEDSQ